MATQGYRLTHTFPNGNSYQSLKLYASDDAALMGCKRLFRTAQPGEALTLIRESGDFVFKLERPLVLVNSLLCSEGAAACQKI